MLFSQVIFFLSLIASNVNAINPNPDTGLFFYLNYMTAQPKLVDSLDIPSFLGLWYQMSSDKIVLSTTEKDVYCATALYGDNGYTQTHTLKYS